MTAVECAHPVRECLAETPFGSLRRWKRHDSSTGPENLRCRRPSLGTCFDEIISDSERDDQESLFLGPPVSRRDRQTRMQNPLSARSFKHVESVARGCNVALHIRPKVFIAKAMMV
jgi:hypothetical protein